MATQRKEWDIAKNREKTNFHRKPWLDVFQAEHYLYLVMKLEIPISRIRKICETKKIKSSKPLEKYLIKPEWLDQFIEGKTKTNSGLMDENKRLEGKSDEILQTMKDQVALQKEPNRINQNLTLTTKHFTKLVGLELEKNDAIQRKEKKCKDFNRKFLERF